MVDDGAYLPSEVEIAEACNVIRRTWTAEEHARRRCGLIDGRHARGVATPPRWSLPVVHVDVEMAIALNA